MESSNGEIKIIVTGYWTGLAFYSDFEGLAGFWLSLSDSPSTKAARE